MLGFSEPLEMQGFVAVAGDIQMLIQKTAECFENLECIKSGLENIVPDIKFKADRIFMEISKL